MDLSTDNGYRKKVFWWIIIGLGALAALHIAKMNNYLLFHVLVELFCIVVGVAIFFIIWNSRKFAGNTFFLILGAAYLNIAFLDLIHTLIYTGMGVFPDVGANPATQLWICARYLEALSILAAVLLSKRKVKGGPLVFVYMVITALCFYFIFGWRIFPDCYIDQAGPLTLFKIVSEYIIIGIFGLAAFFLFRIRNQFKKSVFILLLASIFVTMASELFFTIYDTPTGFFNMMGHYFKGVSYYLIYFAMIRASLIYPYKTLFRELKQSEEALRQSETRYRMLVDNMPEAILVHRNGKYVFANPAAISLFGAKNPKDIIGQSVLDQVVAEDREQIQSRTEQLENSDVFFSSPYLESKIIKLDGTPVDVARVGMPLVFQGQQSGLMVLQDISERKILERKRARENEKRRILLEYSECILTMTTINGIVDQVARAALNTTDSEIVIINYLDKAENIEAVFTLSNLGEPTLVSDPQRTPFQKKLYELIADSHLLRLTDRELRAHPKLNPTQNDLKELNGLLSSHIIYKNEEHSGTIIVSKKSGGLEYTAVDEANLAQLAALSSLAFQQLDARLTLEDQVEERTKELKASEERFRILVEYFPDAIYVMDAQRIIFVNPAAVKLYGAKDAEELVGEPVNRFAPTEFHDAIKERINLALIGKRTVNSWETKLVRLDKSVIDIDTSSLPIEFDGKPVVMGVLRDISAQKRAMEENLQYQQRLSALAADLTTVEEKERRRIADGLHDDVGQKLALVKINLGMFLKILTKDENKQKIHEIRELIGDVISYTRSLTFELSSPILYTSGLDRALEWLCDEFEKKFRVSCEFEGDDKGKTLPENTQTLLFHTCRELIFNAMKHAKSKNVKIHLNVSNSSIKLTVKDNGVGFDTKNVFIGSDRKMGFGLFAIRERISAAGGRLEMVSSPGNGAKITIIVPIVPEKQI